MWDQGQHAALHGLNLEPSAQRNGRFPTQALLIGVQGADITNIPGFHASVKKKVPTGL